MKELVTHLEVVRSGNKDFAPGHDCFPSVSNLTAGVSELLGSCNGLNDATTIFSFWPEVLKESREFSTLQDAGCLINSDLGGLAVEATKKSCRDLIWKSFLKSRYFDQGVSAYWLDETDGEGTGGGDGSHGYDTSYGPSAFASNFWVNDWISIFTAPVAAEKDTEPPLVLTRGTSLNL